MKIILVSDFSDIPSEHSLLKRLFEEGLSLFHLRKHDYTLVQMMNYLDMIPSEYHDRIVIHSHYQLLSVYNLKGSHFCKNYTLDQFLDEADEAIQTLVLSKHVSFSVHSLADIQKLTHDFDYVFISPVFDSISNRGYNARIKINSFRKFLEQKEGRTEVIALGGIKDENVVSAYQAGFDGIAMLGFIWNHFATTGNVEECVARFEQVKNMLDTHVEKDIMFKVG